ncbi:GNAT family N-acetyltransferase [Thermosipho ferrireducens]|uniref:GNAT family N-acetyltransferase n=1 Tax=Thermosipho ferrireducens TaxID=2571116 RepID=A0ABX7S4Q4_9BACT|nr:GNAT family N-acetyltransferase [Thermosipho ferrireducens]QTA37449.1 GNAT family N-acetyltransferase [Thermosipho ferrireducens]
MTEIVKALPSQKYDFSNLMLLSAPEFFPQFLGKRCQQLFEKLFVKTKNLFSYKHTLFAMDKTKVAGMILSYGWKEKNHENLKTGIYMLLHLNILFLKNIKAFLKMNRINNFKQDEYYISNIAVYPEYRGKGIGKQLLKAAENEVLSHDYNYLVLDVESDNDVAVKLYKKFGFKIVKKYQVKLKNTFCFYRMRKLININQKI